MPLCAPFVYMAGIFVPLIIAAVVFLDQLSKFIIISNMYLCESISVIDGFFSITYIQNTGAAFGIFKDNTAMLTLFTGILMAGIIFLVIKKKNELGSFVTICASLVIGGGVGNLIDRALRGYVVDFLDFKVWSPVFNVADIFVCTGCFLIIVYMLFIEGKENGR